MNTEVAKMESTAVSASQAPQEGRNDQILQSDFIIPKILQMQGLSSWVQEGKAGQGDFVRSSTVEVVGGLKSPLDFIPLTFVNLFMLSENTSGDGENFDFRGYEPRTALNEKAEWDFQKDGVAWKRTKVMNLYGLLPRDIEKQAAAIAKFKQDGTMPDLDAAILPIVIPFRNSSFSAAKNVVDLFVKADSLARDMGVDVSVFGRTMTLSNELVTKEKKGKKVSFYVYKVTAAGPTKKEYFETAIRWRNIILSLGSKIKTDESDLEAAPMAGDQEVPF